MRLVAFSDSHGDYDALKAALLARPEADIFVHLGDGEREFEKLRLRFPEKELCFMRGNCDWDGTTKSIELLRLENVSVMLTHGDAHGVKLGLGPLKQAARELGAQIALFGHTHIAYRECEDGLHLLNPGSLSRPHTGAPTYGVIVISDAEGAVKAPHTGAPTYGVVDILPEGIVTSIVEMRQWSD